MSIFDIDHIINGTPKKRLINAYEKMKENYTESSAQDFLNTYNNESLSFLLENSRMIFSEPYYGCKYYTEAMINNCHCAFTALEKEHEKIQNYLEENGSIMDGHQKEMYISLESSIQTLLDHTKNTRIYATYIKEKIDDRFEEKLSNLVLEYTKSDVKDEKEIIELFESVDNPIIFFTYAPYIMEMTNSTTLYSMVKDYCEKCSIPTSYDEDKWTTFVESVICGNKLSLDKVYHEAVNSIQNRDIRFIFEYFMNTSLNNVLNELVEEHVKESDVIYISPVSAINNIFFNIQESSLDVLENEEFKNKIDTYKGIIYESTLDIIITEYQQCDSTEEDALGYSIITESMSLDNAFDYINTQYSENNLYIEEDADDDVDDMDIENLDREIGGQIPGKKIKAPEPKNLSNKIQFNAMDKEVKWQQKNADRKQKGQELKNAAAAATAIPKNVMNDIKAQIREMDKADDERRKKYMTEPGFRKKAFRNLKLALLYGGTASVKLAFVPYVAFIRHLSKKKDRRIRNELVRELKTEIKVCEEKINDANARSDEQEKYRLIRIKDRLDAELARVKVNSKYV